MPNPLEDSGISDLFGSLTNMVGGDSAVLAPLESSDVSLDKLINDHIYGLLSLDELSPQQVAVLAALLQVRG